MASTIVPDKDSYPQWWRWRTTTDRPRLQRDTKWGIQDKRRVFQCSFCTHSESQRLSHNYGTKTVDISLKQNLKYNAWKFDVLLFSHGTADLYKDTSHLQLVFLLKTTKNFDREQNKLRKNLNRSEDHPTFKASR